ncbi:MAG: DUF6632 domain-containing protein [Candidatus Sulfotelmatobacter sp.]
MNRERVQKVVLVVVGLLFIATVYPLVQMVTEETLQMMLSIYVTLGIFLLLASRNPAANRSLIAFAAWSSLAHAAVMTVQSRSDIGERVHLLVGSTAFAVIGIALILLRPMSAVDRTQRAALGEAGPAPLAGGM